MVAALPCKCCLLVLVVLRPFAGHHYIPQMEHLWYQKRSQEICLSVRSGSLNGSVRPRSLNGHLRKNSFPAPFRTAVPLRGQTSQISSSLPPKQDCGPKGVNGDAHAARTRSKPSRRRSLWSKSHLIGCPVCGVIRVDFQHPNRCDET